MRVVEFVNKLKKLSSPIDEYYILGEGAMLLYGVRYDTSNVEICVSKELFYKLLSNGIIDETSKNKLGFYKLKSNPEVMVIPKDKQEFKCIRVGEFLIEDIREILMYKKRKRDTKSKRDVRDIEHFLYTHPTY